MRDNETVVGYIVMIPGVQPYRVDMTDEGVTAAFAPMSRAMAVTIRLWVVGDDMTSTPFWEFANYRAESSPRSWYAADAGADAGEGAAVESAFLAIVARALS